MFAILVGCASGWLFFGVGIVYSTIYIKTKTNTQMTLQLGIFY
jgi:hypothetical protein